MRNGDISNELPKRIIVVLDVFLLTELTVKKRFKVLRVPQVDKKIKRELLSYLYLVTTRQGITLELVSFNMDDEQLESVNNMLDNMGTNPFRYYTAYGSINQLIDELPYRPEVIGVLDKPERLLRYGHWGMDINNL
jgi:hypothetical protein